MLKAGSFTIIFLLQMWHKNVSVGRCHRLICGIRHIYYVAKVQGDLTIDPTKYGPIMGWKLFHFRRIISEIVVYGNYVR